MKDTFITEIQIHNSRNIRNFTILLSKEIRKHLIITGKNGSGKTSLLNDLIIFLKQVENTNYQHYAVNLEQLDSLKQQSSSYSKALFENASDLDDEEPSPRINKFESQIYALSKWLQQFGGTQISFTNSESIIKNSKDGEFLIAFFDAKRLASLTVPNSISKLDLKKKYNIEENASKYFIQYIVNLKADRSFAKDDNENEVVQRIDKWFINFESRLKVLFNCQTLRLKFDRKNYNFEILENNKLPYGFNTLADGYSSIISIATELLLRMEGHGSKAYDMEGIVLIDEIETHLHVELQKNVMPFLIDFFPKIQFIVTTHSPFILNSIENAVICDLEKKFVTSDLTGYSYDTIIESYFNSDLYSSVVKKKIEEYEKLKDNSSLSEEEKLKLHQLKTYFNEIPKFLSDELAVKLQQIRLKDLKIKDE